MSELTKEEFKNYLKNKKSIENKLVSLIKVYLKDAENYELLELYNTIGFFVSGIDGINVYFDDYEHAYNIAIPYDYILNNKLWKKNFLKEKERLEKKEKEQNNFIKKEMEGKEKELIELLYKTNPWYIEILIKELSEDKE